MHSAGSNTATTAARIFSRLDSVEEVQRSRSGSAVGITPGGGAVAAAAVAAGSPARTGGGGVGAGVGNAAGARNRSASTILELSQSQLGAHTRKYSSGGGAALLAGDVNGYGDNAASAKCDTFNGVGASAGAGVGVGAGSGVGIGGGAGAASRGAPQDRSSLGSVNTPVTAVSSLGITLRERLSISGASSSNESGVAASAGGGAGGSAPTIGGSSNTSAPHCKRQGSFSNVFSKLIDGMPAGTMFAKFKSANVAATTSVQNVAEGNPITQYFEIGKPVACAGPELVWRIHDGYRKSDNKVSASKNTVANLNSTNLASPSLSLCFLALPIGMLGLYI